MDDFNYILDENSYYCSDFVERSFRAENIFKLEPMTFIDPKTGKTNAFWEEFYTKKREYKGYRTSVDYYELKK